MRRGEVWWAELADPAGRRPVVLLSRDEAYAIRELVTVAAVTKRVRGIPSEVPLDRSDGLSRACAANLDTITTIPKKLLSRRITVLAPGKLAAIDRALRFALGLIWEGVAQERSG
jgi:mRNA interferase MazF